VPALGGLNPFSAQTSTLQWLDRRLGVPACFVLTMLRRLGEIFTSSAPAAPIRRILFLKLAEQGSTVLAHEAIGRAVALVGRENVFFLVFEENRFVLDALGLIPAANVFTVQTGTPGAMAASCLRQLREIRRRGIDACIDLEFFARSSAAISYLTGARRRVGFHSYFGEGPYRGDLLTHRVLYNSHLHTAQTFSSLVFALGADPAQLPTLDFTPATPTPPPPFQPADGEVAAVQALLAQAGAPAGIGLILLNANASDLLPLRKWKGENYVALAQTLLRELPGVNIAFTGAPGEAPAAELLCRAVSSPRCFSLAGKTSLRQLLVLFGLADILVTNDSGPAHFATLTPIDVVALFGPETPLLFAAPGPRSHPLTAGLACSPCVNAFNNRQSACRDNRCMTHLTVEQVFAAVCRIYRQRPRR